MTILVLPGAQESRLQWSQNTNLAHPDSRAIERSWAQFSASAHPGSTRTGCKQESLHITWLGSWLLGEGSRPERKLCFVHTAAVAAASWHHESIS